MVRDNLFRNLPVLLFCPLLMNVASAQEYWTKTFDTTEACTAGEVNEAACLRIDSCVVTELGSARLPHCVEKIADNVFARNCRTKPASCEYFLDGVISQAKVTKLVDFIGSSSSPDTQLNGIRFYVNSVGGDLRAALELGRALRSRNATVYPKYCASACVFLLAAGVDRAMFQAEPNRSDIVIHRPYSLDTSALDPTEARNQFNQVNAVLAAYLRDMNVSTALLDAMNVLSPHQGKRLTYLELQKFGLTKKDPVYEQLFNA